MDYLNRSQAPFDGAVWKAIDDAAVEAASDLLTGRRFLEIEGPYGAGLTTVEVGNDDYCRQPAAGEAGAVLGRAISVPMLRRGFKLSIRRVAAHLENGQPLNVAPVEDAAEAIAAREEEFIYYGQTDFQLSGLMTAEGRNKQTGGDWTEVDQALTDVLAGVTKLDEAGFRGPYALALEPALYNGLFRRYPGTDMLQLEHLRRLCTNGIYKAPIKGGVLVDHRVGALVIGQDLMAGYSQQDGIHYDLYLSESLVFRLDEPKAICTIEMGRGKARSGG
ncbi:MAG: bacteriocin [Rhodospirillaceae bacterium]|nr:bacteriocin [Rhodospirillaceae bacterium]|tara:strand:- start:301 stop:1128 length:828 start_codon:yes stop_codon:yes gene_type:complete